MKVNHFNAANQVNPYQRQANMTKQVEQAKTNQADKLEISSKALEMQKHHNRSCSPSKGGAIKNASGKWYVSC